MPGGPGCCFFVFAADVLADNDRTVDAVARGQDRILLVMATGTGKTYRKATGFPLRNPVAFICNVIGLISLFFCGSDLGIAVPCKQGFFAFVSKHLVDVAEVQVMIARLHGFLQRDLKGDTAIFGDLNVRPLNALQSNRRFCQFVLFCRRSHCHKP